MPQFTNRPGTAPVDHCNGALGWSRRCGHQGDCLTAYGRQLLEAFRDANPGVSFAESNNPCLSIIGAKRTNRHHPCDSMYLGGIIDHEGAARIGEDQPVYIPQPYLTAHYGKLDGEKETARLAESIAKGGGCLRRSLSGMTLTVRYAGAGRSWYYPGSTALWVVGTPGAVAALNFEYQPPAPPPAMSQRGEKPEPTELEKFDAPSPLPAWELRLPDWTCQHVGRSGKACGKRSVQQEPWPPWWSGETQWDWPERPPPELDRELCKQHRRQAFSRMMREIQIAASPELNDLLTGRAEGRSRKNQDAGRRRSETMNRN